MKDIKSLLPASLGSERKLSLLSLSSADTYLVFAAALFLPALAGAHEVYVLTPETVGAAMANTSPDPLMAFFGNEMRFFFWTFVGAVTVATIAAATFFRLFEATCSPFLSRIKRYALPLARVTAGLSTLSFGIAGALYGTEMPFEALFGAAASVMQLILVILGAALILGFQTRLAALLLSLVYVYAGYVYGWYVLTYTDHIGILLLLLLCGGGRWSLEGRLGIHSLLSFDFVHRLAPLGFPLVRIAFGFGIAFASIYAKYIHSELALQVVQQYELTRYFPFDPLFVVLGALIIEFLAGMLFICGVFVRWTAVFLLFWLSLSLMYFQEAVWPHIILFGLCGVMFLHGYDKFSLEGFWMKRGVKEPVL